MMNMCKHVEKCPECGGTLFVYDEVSGEVICSSCGLVVWEEAVVPGWMGNHSEPFMGVPRAAKIPRGALLALPTESQRRALRKVGRLEGRDKKYIKLTVEVNAIADRIRLPNSIRSLACSLANTIKNGLESSSKRMTNGEIAAVAVWYAAKICGFTITQDDFLKACPPEVEEKFFKLLHKARGFVEAPIAPKSAIKYVPILTAKLSGYPDREYVSALEQYALSIIKVAQPRLKGRDPLATAGTALHIADERMGGRIGRSRLESIGAKFSDRIAKILKSIKAEAPELAQKKMAEYIIMASRRLASGWFK